MKRKILSLLLCVCMALSLLPATVLAAGSTEVQTTTVNAASGELVDEYGFAHSVPDSFVADDGKHPYGNQNGELVNLSPMKEIGLLESASANYYSRVYNFNETSILKGESGGVFGSETKYYLGTSKNFTTATAMSTQVMSSGAPLECVSGVAWDPTGSGRDDYIAYYGTNRSSKKMELYSFRASGGSIGSAKWTGGTYSWIGTLSRYNAEGYTSIVAGDFNADGKDTLIFYDAATGNIVLREYSYGADAAQAIFDLGTSTILSGYFSKTLNQIQAFNTSQARDTAMVQLEAGNIDDDDADELIVTVSLSNLHTEENYMTKTNDRSSVVMVFDKTGSGWVCTWSDQISNVYIAEKKNSYCRQNNGGWYMRAASSRIGDIDGDGTPEILTVGVGSDDHNNDDNFNQSGYIAVIIERDNNGNYGIETTTARHDNGSGQADIALQGYWLPKDSDIPTFEKKVVTVTTDSYTVTFSPGANGGLKAYNITDSSQPFASGASIAKNSELLFTAVPDSGFKVSKWLIDGVEVTGTMQGVTVSGSDLSIMALTGDITVSVEFSNQVHQLTFSASGGGTVKAEQLGTTLTSPANITGGSSVSFTAVPDSGKVVEKWSVSTDGTAQVQTNPDGSTYTGTTLTLDDISADTVVTVTFAEYEEFTVTYAAVDKEHPEQTVTGVTITAEGLNVSGQAQKGSAVTLTASVTPGNAISEWQIKDGDTWNTVAAAQSSYTIYSLQTNTDVRVLVTTGGYVYTVNFGVVNENGEPVEAGTLTAKNVDQDISTGDSCTAYTGLSFTYAGVDSYEVVKWLVNGTSVQEGLDKLSYSIDSLSANTTVNVVVRQKPQITFLQSGIAVSGTVNGSTVDALTSGTYVDYGTDITVSVTPDANHVVTKICGEAVNSGMASGMQSRTFENITGNQSINAELTEKPTVSVGSVSYGTVAFTGTNNGQTVTQASTDKHVDFGSTVTITATPADGYVAATINGAEVNTGKAIGAKSLDITVNSNTTLTAAFLAKPTVTYDSSLTGGTVSVTGTKDGSSKTLNSGDYVDFGGTITVTAAPVGGASGNYVVKSIASSAHTGDTLTGDKTNGSKEKAYTVNADTTITAEFLEKPQVTFDSNISNGSISVSGIKGGSSVTITSTSTDKHVDFNTQITVAAAPDNGYVVDTINGAVVNTGRTNGSITVENVAVPESGKTVAATFLAKPVVTINNSESNKGDVAFTATKDGSEQTLSANSYVDFGSSLTVTLSPKTGYEVGTITGQSPAYTDEAHSDNKTYTVTGVQDDQSIITAWSAIPQYSVTYSVVDTGNGTSGTLTAAAERKGIEDEAYQIDSLASDSQIYRDSTVTFTATPANSNYRVKEWTVNGSVYKPDGTTYIGTTLTLSDIAEAKTVTVQFMEVGSKVTIAAGANGSITSAMVGGLEQVGNITSGFTLSQGAAVAITARPEAGYEVAYWSVNGAEQPDSSKNTFTYTAETEGVGAAITVTFRQIEYPVTWGGANGTVTAGGYAGASADIRGGTEVTFTAAPNDGYVLSSWTVNGVTQSETGSTFAWAVPNGMAADPQVNSYEVKAVFERGKYAVSVTQPENGTITADVEELTAVTGDTEVTFTAEPADGYIVIGWTVDGVTADTRSLTHTVTITKASTVTAVIVPSHYEVSYAAGGETAGGTVTASGSDTGTASVAYGESITFTAAPAL